MKRIGWSVLCGVVVWLGEALIGVVPLGAHEIVVAHIKLAVETGPPLAEVCIIAVVTSGLSLTSLLKFGPHKRKAETTPLTYLLAVISLLSLIIGAILYGLAAVNVTKDQDNTTYYVLAAALISSLCISLEQSVLEA